MVEISNKFDLLSDDDPGPELTTPQELRPPNVVTVDPFSPTVKSNGFKGRERRKRKSERKDEVHVPQREILPGLFEPVKYSKFLLFLLLMVAELKISTSLKYTEKL